MLSFDLPDMKAQSKSYRTGGGVVKMTFDTTSQAGEVRAKIVQGLSVQF